MPTDELDDLIATLASPKPAAPAAPKPVRPRRNNQEHLDVIREQNPDFADVASGFIDFAKKGGLDDVVIRSGYRTAKEQNDIFKGPRGAYTKGNDGYIKISPHQQARAIDWSTNDPANRPKLHSLLASYAGKHKLHIPADEPWHTAGAPPAGQEPSSRTNRQAEPQQGDELDDLIQTLSPRPDTSRPIVGASAVPVRSGNGDNMARRLPLEERNPGVEGKFGYTDTPPPPAPVAEEAETRSRSGGPAWDARLAEIRSQADQRAARKVVRRPPQAESRRPVELRNEDFDWHLGVPASRVNNWFASLPKNQQKRVYQEVESAVQKDEGKKARGDTLTRDPQYQADMRKRLGIRGVPDASQGGRFSESFPATTAGGEQFGFTGDQKGQAWAQFRRTAAIEEELQKSGPGLPPLAKRLKERGIDPTAIVKESAPEVSVSEGEKYAAMSALGMPHSQIKALGIKADRGPTLTEMGVGTEPLTTQSAFTAAVFDTGRSLGRAPLRGVEKGSAHLAEFYAGIANLMSKADPGGYWKGVHDSWLQWEGQKLGDIQREEMSQRLEDLANGNPAPDDFDRTLEALGAAGPTILKYAAVAAIFKGAGMPLSQPALFGAVSAVENGDKSAKDQITELAKNVGMGYALKLTGGLGRVPAAATFAGISGAEAALEGQPVIPAVASGAVIGGALADTEGVKAREIGERTLQVALKNSVTPERARNVIADILKYEKGVVYAEDGRALSVYKDPKSGQWFGNEITREQADAYDLPQNGKPADRLSKEITSDEYDTVISILNIDTKGKGVKPKGLGGETEPIPEETVTPGEKDVTPPKGTDVEGEAAEARTIQEEFLSQKGITMDEARALSVEDQRKLQDEYGDWYDTREARKFKPDQMVHVGGDTQGPYKVEGIKTERGTNWYKLSEVGEVAEINLHDRPALNPHQFKTGDYVERDNFGSDHAQQYEVMVPDKRGMAKLRNVETDEVEDWNAYNNLFHPIDGPTLKKIEKPPAPPEETGPVKGPGTPPATNRVTFKQRGKDLEGEVVREYTTPQGVETVDVRVEGRDKPLTIRKSLTTPVGGKAVEPAAKESDGRRVDERRITEGQPPLGQQERRTRIARRMKKERAGRRSAERLAETDDLTGLGNQRAWTKAVKNIEHLPSTRILSGDINNMKAVNDTQGHAAGDAMIKRAADAMRQAASELGESRLFRSGIGDEISAIVPTAKAEQIRTRAEEIFGEHEADGKRVSFSVGVGSSTTTAEMELMSRKEAAKAKAPAELPALKRQRLAETFARHFVKNPSTLRSWGETLASQSEEATLQSVRRIVSEHILDMPDANAEAFEPDDGPAYNRHIDKFAEHVFNRLKAAIAGTGEKPAPPPAPAPRPGPPPTPKPPTAKPPTAPPQAGGGPNPTPAPKPAGDVTGGMSPEAKAALDRLRGKFKKTSAPRGSMGMPEQGPDFGADDVLDAALVGHELFKAGLRDQESWTAQMVDLVGPAIEDYLADVWESAVIEHEGQGESVDDLPEWKAPAKVEEKDVDKPDDQNLVFGTSKLIRSLLRRIENSEQLDWRTLDKLADEAFGGSRAEGRYSPRDMYDAMESAIAEWVADWSELKKTPTLEALKMLRAVIGRLPTQTSRNDEQVQRQQFSTPPTIGLVAGTALDVQPTDIGLEPSAGTGLLAAFLKAMGAKEVHVNEIAPRRLALLRRQGYTSENSVDAQRINAYLPQEIRPTIVLMNPPFSTQEGIEKHDTRYGFEHLASALARLQDGGRLVAIMGESASLNREKMQGLWDKIMQRYTVRANIAIPGKEYGKFGTTFGTQIVIIDKVGPTEGATFIERFRNVRQDEPADLEGVLDVLKEIPKRAELKPGLGETGGGDKPTAGGKPEREGGGAGPSGRPDSDKPTGGAGTDVGDDSPRGTGEAGGTKPEGDKGTEPTGDSDGAGTQPGGRTEPGEPEEDSGITFDTEAETTESESDLFVQYKPAKLRGGVDHPGRIVESASMAAVEPPDITYTPNLPASVIKKGVLSDLQLEAVTYAGQRHQQHLPDGNRAAYFIGDGTGVGKGRMLMGIGLDNWRTWTKEKKKRRILYTSVNYDLVESAERDMKALLELPDTATLSEHFPFHILNDFRPGDLLDELAGDGMMFASYSTFISEGQNGSRYDDLVAWLGEDGLIIFDEAHKAKNAVDALGTGGTQTGEKVVEIQIGDKTNKNWKFVYASATGATEVRNMAYMARLGLWGPGLSFNDFVHFETTIDGGGLGAMEMVARDMKALGMYRAVSLSYKGVTYRDLTHELGDTQKDVYNSAARAWQMVQEKIEEAMIAQRPNSRTKSLILSQFYSGQQRFFRQVLTAMKLPTVLKDVEKVLRDGIEYENPDTGEITQMPAQVILGFIYTGESQMSRNVREAQSSGGSLEDLDFSPAHILRGFVEKYFPTQLFTDVPIPGTTRTKREPVVDEDGNPVHDPEMLAIKRAVMAELENLTLPENPLDQVINHFGEGAVAELSGRGHRMIRDPDSGQTEYRPRLGGEAEGRKRSRKRANEHEMEDYQAGKKKIAVITQAASTGISLHSDLKTPSKGSRRVHYTVETAWSADQMMQTLGRGHRSGQGSEPEMVLAGTDVGGESRFLATIAKRMGSLGALSRGERKASSSAYDKYDFENHYGVTAARSMLAAIDGRNAPPAYADAPQDFDSFATAVKMGLVEKDREGNPVRIKTQDLNSIGVGKFLNRILALELADQDVMFKWFIGYLDQIIKQAKEEGTFDEGIADVKGESVRMVGEPQVVARDQTTGAASHYVQIESDEPIEKVEWDSITPYFNRGRTTVGPGYKLWMQKTTHKVVFLEPGASRTDPKTGNTTQYFHVVRPGGVSDTLISGDDVVDKYTQVDEFAELPLKLRKAKKLKPAELAARMKLSADVAGATGKGLTEFEPQRPITVREWWNQEFQEVQGFKTKKYHLITSPVIPIWERLATRDSAGNATRLRALRATTDDGKRIVGVNIPARAVSRVLRALGVGASKRSVEEIFNAIYLDGETVELVGNMKLRRTNLRGNRAIELWGVDRNQRKIVLDMGVITERRGFDDLFLVPTDAAKGIPVLEKLLARYPPFDATAAAEGGEIDTGDEGEANEIEGGMGMPTDVDDFTGDAFQDYEGKSREAQAESEERYVESAQDVEHGDVYSVDQEAEGLDDYEARQMARITGIRDWDIRMDPEAGYEKAQVSTADVRNQFLKMFKAIGHATDIRAGRLGTKRALGITKLHSQIIRLRNAWNVPVMAHEAGHALQAAVYGSSMASAIKHLPLNVRRELISLGKDLYGATVPYGGYTAEGFAEFMRYYLTTEEAPKRARRMTHYFENTVLPANPKLAKSIPKVRKIIDQYRFQGEVNRTQAMMESGDKNGEKRLQDAINGLKQMRTDWIDEITPLIDFTRQFETLTSEKLNPSESPAALADFYRGAGNSTTRYMLETAMVDSDMNKVGPSFQHAVVGPISNVGKKLGMGPIELLGHYLWALRAIERLSPNLLGGEASGGAGMYSVWPRRSKDVKDPGKSLEQATYLKRAIEEAAPEVQISAAGWYQWWDGVISYIKGVNPDLAPTINKQLRASAYYAPLMRAFDEMDTSILGKKKPFTGSSGVYRMRGSQRRVTNVMLQTFLNVERMITNAHKHRVLTAMTDLDDRPGIGQIFERVPRGIIPQSIELDRIRKALEDIGVDTSGARGDEIITYFMPQQTPMGKDPIMPVVKGDHVEWYYIPAELYNSLSGLDIFRPDKTLMLALGYWARGFRLGTTGVRASFGLFTNPLRDATTWFGQSQVKTNNPLKRAGDYLHGLSSIVAHLIRNPKGGKLGELQELTDLFDRLGVKMSQPLGYDMAATRHETKRLFRPKGKEILRRPLERIVTSTPIDFLREVFGIPEAFPRIAEMKGIMAERGYTPGTTLTLDDAIALSLAGKQSTVDFLATGRKGKYVNQVVPFFNPNIQGNRSFLRAFKRGPLNALLRGLGLTLATLLFWWTVKDEPWYRGLKSYERFAFWNIKVGDEILQIPRSQEWGTIFATIPEALIDAAYQDNPDEVAEMMGHTFDVVTPPVMPVPVRAGVEQAANWNEFFSKPIVPKGMEDRPALEQQNEYTSEVAKFIAERLPDARIPYLNIPLNSPMRIDAAIREFGGGAAADLANAPRTARAAGRAAAGVLGYGTKGEDYELSDLPVVGKAFRRGGTSGTGSPMLDKFYDKLNAARTKALSKTTDETSAERDARLQLESANVAIKALRDEARSSQDAGRRREMYQEINGIASRAARGEQVYKPKKETEHQVEKRAKAKDKKESKAVDRWLGPGRASEFGIERPRK